MDSAPLIFIAIGIVAGLGGLFGGRMIRKRFDTFSRRRKLVAAYGAETGGRIAEGKIWVGMSERQLSAARGKPAEIKEKAFARRDGGEYTRETWSYRAPGENRIALRVYVEDGKVVGFKE